MSMKALQILLVVAAVLCALGIALAVSGDDRTSPRVFEPPAWLEWLEALAGGPRLSAGALTRDGRSFPGTLRLGGGETVRFEAAASADAETRRIGFEVRGPGRRDVRIRYRPVPGQRLNGEPVDAQRWPNQEDGAPRFVVYDGGGAFRFRNTGADPAEIRIED